MTFELEEVILMEWGGAEIVSLTRGIFSQISLNVEESKGHSRSVCFPKVTIKGNRYSRVGGSLFHRR